MGCETVDMTLRRNGLGQLGFHVRLDGTVAEVRRDSTSEIPVKTHGRFENPFFFFTTVSGGGLWLRLASRSQTG